MSEKKIIIGVDLSKGKREIAKFREELGKDVKVNLRVDQRTNSLLTGEATKHVRSLKRAMAEIPGMGGGGGGIGLPSGGGMLPGMVGRSGGGIMGSVGSMFRSFAGGAGMLKYATAAGVAMAIGGRLLSSYNTGVAANDQYVNLRSLGVSPGGMRNKMAQGIKNLYSPEETRSLTADFIRNVGYSPSDQNVNMMQKFSRAWGVDTSVVGGTAASIYRAGGSGANVYREQAEILASAIGAKLDRGKLSEYLQTVASTIDAMASQTSGVSTGNIATMMGLMSGMGGAMTPGLAATNLSKLDQGIRNPDQKQAAMVYATIAQTLKQGGYEGDLPSAIRVIQETGLAGLNADDLESKFPNLAKSGKLGDYKKIFKAWNPVNYTKNLAGNIESATGNNTTLGGLYGGRHFAGGPAMTSEFIEATKQKGYSTAQAMDWIKKSGPQTEKNLGDVVNSQEGITKELEAVNKFNKEQIGMKLIPVVNEMKKFLQNIESVLIPVLGPMAEAAKALNPMTAVNDVVDMGKKGWNFMMYGNKKQFAPNSPADFGSMGNKGKESALIEGLSGFTGFKGGGNEMGVDIKTSGGIKFKNAGAEEGFKHLAKQMQKDLMSLSTPVTITSGKRSTAENANLTGSAKNSRHLTGEAADLSIKNMKQEQVDRTLAELRAKGYKAFVHGGGGVTPHIHVEMTGQRGSGTNKGIMPADIVGYHHH